MAFKKFTFDPIKELDLNIPRKNRKDALEEAAAYLREVMLEYASEGKSVVSGGKWIKTLTPGYARKKGEESSVTFANLELSGHLLDNLGVDVSGRGLTIDVDPEDYGKAEGHLTGEYGKNSRIRPRQFMPQPGETFKSTILSDLKKILRDFEED